MANAVQPPWAIERGSTIRRKELHDRYGGVRQGGVSPSIDSPNIFLFSDDTANQAHGYVRDRWAAPDLFLYCGEGQQDENQTLSRYNGSILTHAESGRSLRLFKGWRGMVTYVGEFELDRGEPYFWTVAPNHRGISRRVVMFRLRPIGFVGPQVPTDIGLLDHVADLNGDNLRPRVRPYEWVDEDIQSRMPLPFAVDPNVVDRGLQGHATTQNLLAEWLVRSGIEPLSPADGAPAFDLAWSEGDIEFVGEVKSLSRSNEVSQLRLGLGQVLDYAEQLGWRPVLMVERRPASGRWHRLCDRLGVHLLWPSRLRNLSPGDLLHRLPDDGHEHPASRTD